MKSIIKKTTVFALVTGAFLSSACATVEGAGKDIEAAGEKISEVARDNE